MAPSCGRMRRSRAPVLLQLDGSGRLPGTCPTLSGVRRHVDHYGFVSLVVDSAFDSAGVCLAFCHSAEVNWSSNDGVPSCFS